MIHDELCPQTHSGCYCDLIMTVRLSERRLALQRAENIPHSKWCDSNPGIDSKGCSCVREETINVFRSAVKVAEAASAYFEKTLST